jgi:hypothetical protein
MPTLRLFFVGVDNSWRRTESPCGRGAKRIGSDKDFG